MPIPLQRARSKQVFCGFAVLSNLFTNQRRLSSTAVLARSPFSWRRLVDTNKQSQTHHPPLHYKALRPSQLIRLRTPVPVYNRGQPDRTHQLSSLSPWVKPPQYSQRDFGNGHLPRPSPCTGHALAKRTSRPRCALPRPSSAHGDSCYPEAKSQTSPPWLLRR